MWTDEECICPFRCLTHQFPPQKQIRRDHNRTGQYPGDRIDNHNNPEFMYGTADGVDPDKAQHTGADHGDQSRCQGMAKASHGTAADLVSGGQKFQCGDDQKALYGKSQDIWIGRVQAKEKVPAKYKNTG